MMPLSENWRAWPAKDRRRLLRRLQGRTSGPSTLTAYQTDPVGYARDILGATLTTDQEAILRSVATQRRTAVQASHAIGKTFIAAVAANWWYDCWDQHIVYLTAPSWPQALGLTFKEIKRARRAHRLPGDILESGLVRDPDKDREPGHFIRALNAENGEGFQGEHTSPILIILEEAVGVPPYIFAASDGLMTVPECRLLAIANPTDEANRFGELAADPAVATICISALDHPNIQAELRGAPPPFPSAVRLLWLAEMLRKECLVVDQAAADTFEWVALDQVDAAAAGRPADLARRGLYLPNAVFQGRVLGQFPTQAGEQVIPRGWLTACPVLVPAGSVEIGCDVARFGDDRTTIAGRHGPCALLFDELRQLDSVLVADALRQAAARLSALTGVPAQAIAIKIDVTGGLGTGPADFLRAEGYRIVDCNASEAAYAPDTYPNRRSEQWFASRDAAYDHRLDLSRLPDDLRGRLIKELCAPRWKPDGRGRKVVESKADLKKRYGSSPDLADAWNLALAPAPEVRHEEYPW